jgi:hypothetical protein
MNMWKLRDSITGGARPELDSDTLFHEIPLKRTRSASSLSKEGAAGIIAAVPGTPLLPSVKRLIQRCWAPSVLDRPADFGEIIETLEIAQKGIVEGIAEEVIAEEELAADSIELERKGKGRLQKEKEATRRSSIVMKVLSHRMLYKIQREEFFENKKLVEIRGSWEAGNIEGEKAAAEATAIGNPLKGMCIPPLKLKNPIFTHFCESKEKPQPEVVFYEDDEMIIFPNNKSHLREKDGDSAAMSFVHLLAITKRRVYNAVSLKVEHLEILKRLKIKAAELLLTEVVRDYYLKGKKLEVSSKALDPK